MEKVTILGASLVSAGPLHPDKKASINKSVRRRTSILVSLTEHGVPLEMALAFALVARMPNVSHTLVLRL